MSENHGFLALCRTVDINDFVIQSDGKILAVGEADDGYKSGRTTIDNTDIALARYNPNGTLDTTFGSGGKVTTAVSTSPSTTVPWENYYDSGRAVAIEPDGKILVAGTTYDGAYGLDYVLLRYFGTATTVNGITYPAGSLDPSFGSGGKVITTVTHGDDRLYGMALQTVMVNGTPTTMIVVAGSTPGDSVVVRYNLDGSLDPTFGSSGIVTLSTNVNATTYLAFKVGGAIAIQPDQKIVIDGHASPTPIPIPPQRPPAPVNTQFAVIRLNPDGSFDTMFNQFGQKQGVATIGSSTASSSATAVALQPDGKILVAGDVQSSSSSATLDTALARFNTDGTPDLTFGSNGLVVQAFSTSTDLAGSLTLQPDGKIVIAGDAATSNGQNLYVARFLNQAPTTTTLASSLNPSNYGDTVTFTATVSAVGAFAPTGTVDFYDGATLLDTAPLVVTINGVATAVFTISTLSPGTHNIRAIYDGDANNMSSTSAYLSQVVN
jgi:uncharacterized delta-60 repeat protein